MKEVCKYPVKRCALLTLLAMLTFLVSQVCALACSGPGVGVIRSTNYEMSVGYGRVSALFTAAVLYMQWRRVGFKRTTFGLAGLFILLYFGNEGWHPNVLSGDCGYSAVSNARQSMFLIGLLLAYQIAASLLTLWRSKPGGIKEEHTEKQRIGRVEALVLALPFLHLLSFYGFTTGCIRLVYWPPSIKMSAAFGAPAFLCSVAYLYVLLNLHERHEGDWKWYREGLISATFLLILFFWGML